MKKYTISLKSLTFMHVFFRPMYNEPLNKPKRLKTTRKLKTESLILLLNETTNLNHPRQIKSRSFQAHKNTSFLLLHSF